VWYAYTPDRKGEHPRAHLREFSGTLQADAYAGWDSGNPSSGFGWIAVGRFDF